VLRRRRARQLALLLPHLEHRRARGVLAASAEPLSAVQSGVKAKAAAPRPGLL
jgi:hypothetical protein